ncbi:hypothetical protein DL96DRAFT_1130006 [Flagelloscypha sp. PMI_526]|nr:hypothetical protein DL96DRAFT_1130006 [Flagelloscypha sp. PMI_526]
MASLLKAYNSALLRRPMATQCLTAAALFGTGDLIAQQVIEKRGKEHDFFRTLRLATYGGIFFAPAMTKWYQFLNRLQFKTETRAIIYRVYADQFLLTPVAVAYFYGTMSVLEGKPGEAVDRIKTGYVPTIIRNWGVFIPTQIVNFALVPPHFRFFVVSVVSLFWNTYLSYANAQNAKLVDGGEAKEEHAKEQ